MRTNTEPWCIFCVNFEYLILMDMGKMQRKSQLLIMLWYISKLSILIAVDFEQLHVDRSELSQRSVFGFLGLREYTPLLVHWSPRWTSLFSFVQQETEFQNQFNEDNPPNFWLSTVD